MEETVIQSKGMMIDLVETFAMVCVLGVVLATASAAEVVVWFSRVVTGGECEGK